MLSFFLTLFQGLRVQMGVPFTEQIIQTFLNMFTRYCPMLVTSVLSLGMIYLHKPLTQRVPALKNVVFPTPWCLGFCHVPGLNLRKMLPGLESPSPCLSVIQATGQLQLSTGFLEVCDTEWEPHFGLLAPRGYPNNLKLLLRTGGFCQNLAPFCGLMYLVCISRASLEALPAFL